MYFIQTNNYYKVLSPFQLILLYLSPSLLHSLSHTHRHTHTQTHTQCISTVIKFYESNTESHGLNHMDRRVYEEFLERQKRGDGYKLTWGCFYTWYLSYIFLQVPMGHNLHSSCPRHIVVCVILVAITEPKEKQHTHQNPCIYNHLLFSCSVMSDSLQPQGLQHTRPPCPSLSPGVCSNSCPLSQLCYLTMMSSATLFFCLQSFPVSRLFASVVKVLELQLQHQSFQ